MKKNYIQDGYVIWNDVFSNYDITTLREQILSLMGCSSDKDVFNLAVDDFQAYYQNAKAAQHLPLLHNLGSRSEIIYPIRHLGLKTPLLSMKPIVLFSAKALATHSFYWKSEPHQDWSGMQGSLNGLVAWVPLVNVTDDLGRLEVIPGSHLRGLMNHIKDGPGHVIRESLDGWEPVDVPVGSVLFMSSFLIHRSGVNKTIDKIRLTASFRYDDADEVSFINRGRPNNWLYQRQNENNYIPTLNEVKNVFSDNVECN